MTIDNRDLSDIEILALTIYGEARGESIAGQVAVGCVIRNRTIKDNYRDICLAPKQFSCWNLDDPNRALLDELGLKLFSGEVPDEIKQELWVAQGIINDAIKDSTKGAKNYLTTSLFYSNKRPSWARDAINENQIDKQVYFNV
jgi:hypothetical protein